MKTVSPLRPSIELADAIRANQQLGWTWETVRDHGGPSTTKITQLVNLKGTVSTSTLEKLEDAYGWRSGLGLDLVSGTKATRRDALMVAVVGPPRKDHPRGYQSHGGEDLTVGERTEVIEALRAMGEQMIALAARLAPEEKPD